MTARMHLLSALAMCFLVAVSCQCPDDVPQSVQLCLINSDVFALFSQFFGTVKEAQTFCEVSVQKVHDCVAVLKEQCKTNQSNIFTLTVNEQKIGSALQNFCAAFPELLKNPHCFDSPQHKTSCLASSARNFSYNVNTDDKSSRRFVMDMSCVYYTSMEQCFLGSFPKGCENESAIFRQMFTAMEYPYCSLSDQKKNEIFPTTTSTTTPITTRTTTRTTTPTTAPTTTPTTTPTTKPTTAPTTTPTTKPTTTPTTAPTTTPTFKVSTKPSAKSSTEPSLTPSEKATKVTPVLSTGTIGPITAGQRVAASVGVMICALFASFLYPLVT